MNGAERTGEAGPAALPSGAQVGGFSIQSVLGSGGFGITYLARHQALGKSFAIKEYFPEQFSYRETTYVRPTASGTKDYLWGLDRFEKEAQALAKFKHPSIVDVSDIFAGNGTAYMVLAYEPGPNLGRWIRELGRPPTQKELDAIVVPLLDAVELVHARNMLHRDIAPDNVLVRPDGTPVLIDFGAARDDLQRRTARVTAVVKPGYSPPEQYQSDPASQGPWSDIYGFGATLYYAVAGALPGDQGDAFDARRKTGVAQWARGSYRPKCLAAIDWALRPDPLDRPQSIPQWRARLLDSTPEPALNEPATRKVQDRSRVFRPWQWVAGTAAALAFALAICVLVWPCRILGIACEGSAVSTGALQIELDLPKDTFSVGDNLTFRVRSNRDCYFMIYTVSPTGVIEVHDPMHEELFMGKPMLMANEWRQLPTRGYATVNPEAGRFELEAICSKEPLSSLGLSINDLREPARGGRRSFSFALDKATKVARPTDVAHASTHYEVKP